MTTLGCNAPSIILNRYGYSRKYALGIWQTLASVRKSKQGPELHVSLSDQENQAKIISETYDHEMILN